MSTGRRRADVPRSTGRVPDGVLHGVGVLLAVAAWGVLVLVAIHLGRQAQEGAGAGLWVLTALATLAGAAFLLAAFLLLGRLRASVAGRAPRHPGRHR